jgi:hypothetical protein
MVLHRKDRQFAVPKPLDGAVVQIDVRDLEERSPRDLVLVSANGEAMVLRRDDDAPRGQLLDRVIAPAVPVGELHG